MVNESVVNDVPFSAELILPAPAKLNRMLHITGRRDDGYHELQTLFQFVDIADQLYFRRRTDGKIKLTPPLPGVDENDNLIIRAARLLQEVSGCRLGADIYLDKHLPMGGGLGGGSSDAATTLLALERLWGLSIGTQQLATLGLALGADVPVFIHGRAAWAEGVGERLTPVELDTPWFVILHPDITISTAAIFKAPQLTRNSPAISMARALQGAATWRNDCEATVRQLYPEVAAAIDWLSCQAPTMLTGTGACFFARLTSEAQADNILRQISPSWLAFKARGHNISPLHAALGKMT